MESKSDLKVIFEPLRKEESSTVREAVETLIKITRNVLQSDDPKYRRIKTSNIAFVNKVWKHVACQRLLFAVGWTLDKDKEGNEVICITCTHHLPDFLEFLMAERVMNQKTGEPESEQLKESKKLAEKARVQKKEMHSLGETIKQNIKSDREYRNLRAPKTDHQLLVKKKQKEQKNDVVALPDTVSDTSSDDSLDSNTI